MHIVEVEGLCHSYNNKRVWANKDVQFSIQSKGVIGLLGSNGAGKSTLMNIICGVVHQTSGKVRIYGSDIEKDSMTAKKQIGFLPQTAPLYLDLTVNEYLYHCALLRGMEKSQIPSAVEEVKKSVQISHFSKRLIKNLSGGYRQRVGIAQAIIHKPKLVVLDEPTIGLDPNQIVEVRNLVCEIAKERTVLFSTHILHEVDLMCSHVLMMDGGRLIFNGTLNEFRQIESSDKVLLTVGRMPAEKEFLSIEGITGFDYINHQKLRISFENNPGITNQLIRKSVEQNWELQEIHYEQKTLDAIFSKLSSKPS